MENEKIRPAKMCKRPLILTKIAGDCAFEFHEIRRESCPVSLELVVPNVLIIVCLASHSGGRKSEKHFGALTISGMTEFIRGDVFIIFSCRR